jgi:hypothetical protein
MSELRKTILAITSFAILAGLAGAVNPLAFSLLTGLAFLAALVCALAYNGQLFERLIAEHGRAARLGAQLTQEGRDVNDFPRDTRGLGPLMGILRFLSGGLAVLALVALLAGRPADPLAALLLTFGLLALAGLFAIPVVTSALSLLALRSANAEIEPGTRIQSEIRALIERLGTSEISAERGVDDTERRAEAGMAIAAHVLGLGAQILVEHPPIHGKTIVFSIDLAGLQAALEPGPVQGPRYWIAWASALLAKLPPAWAGALVAGVAAQAEAITAAASVAVGTAPASLRIQLRISA